MKLSEIFRKKVYEATGGDIDIPKTRGRTPDYIKEMEDYAKSQKKKEGSAKKKSTTKKVASKTKPKTQAKKKTLGQELTGNRAAKVPRKSKKSAAQINKEIEAKSPNLPTNPDLKALETGKKVASARKKTAKPSKPLPNVAKSNSKNTDNCYIVRLQTGNGNISEKKFTSKSSAKRKFNSMLKSMQGQGAKFKMKSIANNKDGTHADSTNMKASLKMLSMPCDVEPVNIIMGGGRRADPNSQWV